MIRRGVGDRPPAGVGQHDVGAPAVAGALLPPDEVPPLVFGDCRGRTADGWVSSEAVAIARKTGFEAGLTDPFAGGHIIARHGSPHRSVHALQVEIDRRTYLDARLQKPGAGFDKVATLIETLTVELGQSLIGRQYATAAE